MAGFPPRSAGRVTHQRGGKGCKGKFRDRNADKALSAEREWPRCLLVRRGEESPNQVDSSAHFASVVLLWMNVRVYIRIWLSLIIESPTLDPSHLDLVERIHSPHTSLALSQPDEAIYICGPDPSFVKCPYILADKPFQPQCAKGRKKWMLYSHRGPVSSSTSS